MTALPNAIAAFVRRYPIDTVLIVVLAWLVAKTLVLGTGS